MSPDSGSISIGDSLKILQRREVAQESSEPAVPLDSHPSDWLTAVSKGKSHQGGSSYFCFSLLIVTGPAVFLGKKQIGHSWEI